MDAHEILSTHQIPAPDALRLEHDDIAAQLLTVSREGGQIGEAAKRVALLCVPHFHEEEKRVFPIFESVRRLAAEDVPAAASAILPLVSNFTRHHGEVQQHHESISSTLAEFAQLAREEHREDIADFAYRFRLHELIEDEVIYPMAGVIGNYVRDRLTPGMARSSRTTEELESCLTHLRDADDKRRATVMERVVRADDSGEERWEFIEERDGRFRWRRLRKNGTVLAASAARHVFFTSCLDDAQRHGFVL